MLPQNSPRLSKVAGAVIKPLLLVKRYYVLHEKVSAMISDLLASSQISKYISIFSSLSHMHMGWLAGQSGVWGFSTNTKLKMGTLF